MRPSSRSRHAQKGGSWACNCLVFPSQSTLILSRCWSKRAEINATLIVATQALAWYISAANDAVAAVQSAFQAVSLAQDSGIAALALNTIGAAITYTVGTGQLHEAQCLTQQAMLLGKQPGGLVLPEMGYPSSFQAEILREWNELDAARSVAEEAVSLCKQSESVISLVFLLSSHAISLRISHARGELDAARSALQECERIGMNMNQSLYHLISSHFTIIDQVKLWLACGELDRSMRWAEKLDLRERQNNSYICEREEVAYVRVLLAKHQPGPALERLEPVLQRATTGQRWGHVIEIRLLQALAYQMHQQERQALDTLLQAVRLAEPENYIRSFVDEGAQM